jgi:hypothetical protein
MICRPKDQNGLGVLNLRTQNKALPMKNLFKFYNHDDIPWVNLVWQAYYYNNNTPQFCTHKGSFRWKDCLALMDDFREMTSCTVYNGKSVSLWYDKWDDDYIKEREDPRLFSFVNNDKINIHDAINMDVIYDLFHLPLSTEAHQ